jgi:hypothetical protein
VQADLYARTSKMKQVKTVLSTALITIEAVFTVVILGDGWADI